MTPDSIAAELTAILRTPTGTMALRQLQGQCLMGADAARGVFTNGAVGLGKSLAEVLCMTLIGGSRPVLITDSSMVKQLTNAFEQYRKHWRMPTYYRILSYNSLSNQRGILDEIRPTFVGLDEAHRLKALHESGRARQFARWRIANPTVPVGCFSGSPGKHFEQYAHLILWALPQLAAMNGGRIPTDENLLPQGAEFKLFAKRLKEDTGFRDVFWDWLRAQPGIVISSETFTERELHIKHTIVPTPEDMVAHWDRLRVFGEAPDGWRLEGPGEQWGVARCMSNGMYYEHIPRPPEPYSQARKEWIQFTEYTKERGERAPGGPYDTPGQVAEGVLAGHLSRLEYDAWMRVKGTYTPIVRPAWLSRAFLDTMAEWGSVPAADKGGRIIWVEQTGFGEALSAMTGWPYYGDGACNARRQHVRDANARHGSPTIICSVKSCGTGIDGLQKSYWHNAITSPFSNNELCEQTLGRTHRSGLVAPFATAELFYGCLEDWCGVLKAEAEARVAEEDLTAPPKLLLAKHTRTRYPTEEDAGPAWSRAGKVVVEVPD